MDNELLKTRIRPLNDATAQDGKCVLYIMSRDQRVQDNHALVAAQKHAQAKGLPLCVVFCLYEKSGYRRREQYQFMLDGLRGVEADLAQLNIPFMMLLGKPVDRLQATFKHLQPDAVYFDMNPLRGPRRLQHALAKQAACKMYVVDTHNTIPVWITSDKREVGARTIRTKVHKKFGEYLSEPEQVVKQTIEWPGTVKSMEDLSERINEVLASIDSCGIDVSYEPGEQAARKRLDTFVEAELDTYAAQRNDPSNDALSGMSPYLHFGQISALRVALQMQHVVNGAGASLHLLESSKMPQAEDVPSTKVASANALLEEMIVRKELSDNFCYYEPNYDNIAAADNWAKDTVTLHDADEREYTYTYDQLENAQTHDLAWNAAQLQLRKTGKMHGYMRMYWAKKVKEWTPQASTAIEWLIELNDTYSIDGGDPNGYVGILWSVIGVHDRPWTERAVFGKVRYMNYAGLKRKFNIEKYQQQWTSGGNATLDV